MHKPGHCVSAVLASALRILDSYYSYDLNNARKCVRALADLSLIAQYRSHTPDTPVYMERYLQTFHRSKDIFLRFRTSKATGPEANGQDRDLRELIANQRANEARPNTATKRPRQVDQQRLEMANQRAEWIRRENHFNLIKMHYMSHFASNVRRFGYISMYCTAIGELADNQQIKDCYRRSNKNEATPEILSQYGRQHSLGMRLQTIEGHLKAGVIEVGNRGIEMLTSLSGSAPRRMLKGRTNIGTLSKLYQTHEIEECDMIEQLQHCIKETAADHLRLPADPTELGLLRVE